MTRIQCSAMLAAGLSGFAPSMVPAQARATAGGWSVASSPALTLGRGEKEGEFFSAVAGATRLPDGRIIVGDRGEYALHVFSAAGVHERRFARKGKGPGEVTSLLSLLRCGDAVVTVDIDGGRVSTFALDGTFRTVFRHPELPYRTACNTRGQFAVMGWERDSDVKTGVSRSSAAYWIASADGTPLARLANLPGSERFGTRPLPLGREPRVAMATGRMYVALADSMHILAFDLAGKSVSALRANCGGVASTAADMTAEMEREVALLGEKYRKRIELQYREIPKPQRLPATRDLVVDADDNLWVQHFPRAASPTVSWTVFTPAGRVAAEVALPASLEVYEIGRDYVLGRYVDADDLIPEVRLYRLSRR